MKVTVEFELEVSPTQYVSHPGKLHAKLTEELREYIPECNYPEMCQEPEVAGYDFFKHFFYNDAKAPTLQCWDNNVKFMVKSLKFKV